MPKHLYLLILATFVTGVIAGVYTFFMTRDAGDTGAMRPAVVRGYEVIAYEYGGCESAGCGSFRLTDDGSYMFIVRNGAKESERFEDSISARQRKELDELIASTPYAKVGKSEHRGPCPADGGGTAYRFEIRVENERYSFDSCIESLDGEDLFAQLVKYFDIMRATYKSQ